MAETVERVLNPQRMKIGKPDVVERRMEVGVGESGVLVLEHRVDVQDSKVLLGVPEATFAWGRDAVAEKDPSGEGVESVENTAVEELVGLMDAFVGYLEGEMGVVDYHLQITPLRLEKVSRKKMRKVVARMGSTPWGLLAYYGNPERDGPYNLGKPCASCEEQSSVAMQSYVCENDGCNMWLDAKGRPMWIVTPKRHLRAWSEYSGEEKVWVMEMIVFALCAPGNAHSFVSIKLNHGTYQNWAHSHFKLTLWPENWPDAVRSVQSHLSPASSSPGEGGIVSARVSPESLVERMDELLEVARIRKEERARARGGGGGGGGKDRRNWKR